MDLGLPSGLKWCNCNLGAKKPDEEGLFFEWGNIVGHYRNDGYSFNQENYALTPGSSLTGDLDAEHDAATQMLGSAYRIPTLADFEELIANCTFSWVTYQGHRGYLVKSNVNGDTIFLPALGLIRGTADNEYNLHGYFWTNAYRSSENAGALYFASNEKVPTASIPKYLGVNIRPVFDPNL